MARYKTSIKKREYNKKWRKENPEKMKLACKIWRENNRDRTRFLYRRWSKNNPKKIKAKNLRFKFGITLEKYKEILDRQKGLCAICQKEYKPRKNRSLAVDHSHHTGKIRGLLCNVCNRGLGYFRDDISVLENAISYLKNGNLFFEEPQKSFRKAGITNGDDILTEDGEKVFMSWLLHSKFAEEFKKDVVQDMLDEQKKEEEK